MTAAVDRARIGPNAIIQVTGAASDRFGEEFAEPLLFESTGYTMTAMPTAMVDERKAQALMGALVARVGPGAAIPVLRDAGYRTADYLLANRIPRAAQWLIRHAPRRTGLWILLRAMLANSWTFAGSGQFRVISHGGWPELQFEDCAICREMESLHPMCDFYAGTFERLIRTLVAPDAEVHEVECLAQGDHLCRFVLTGL
jgi:divinyl protochlorophyllide a 8-vinyl-reductase